MNADFEDQEKRTLMKLLPGAIWALTNRLVIPIYQKPFIENCVGICYRNVQGEICVDLDPRENSSTLYSAWLEECSHIILGHVDRKSPVDFAMLPEPARSIFEKRLMRIKQTEEDQIQYRTNPEEIEASEMRHAQDAFALKGAQAKWGRVDSNRESLLPGKY